MAIVGFSALQRAEIAEIEDTVVTVDETAGFSALQRAEIAEIHRIVELDTCVAAVSVLFNEPKLLKLNVALDIQATPYPFQCSSTSRNC